MKSLTLTNIFIFCLPVLISCSTKSKMNIAEREPATELRSKNSEDTSYLDIRWVDLPSYLRSESKRDLGVQIFECSSDNCFPISNEVLTYEEVKGRLVRHNTVYIVSGAILAASVVGVGAAAGAGALIQVPAGIGISIMPGAIGGVVGGVPGSIIGAAAGGTTFLVSIAGTTSVVGAHIAKTMGMATAIGISAGMSMSAIAGTLAGPVIWFTNKMKGRQMYIGTLPKDGPLLRKLLSKKEVIVVNNIDRLKKEFLEIIEMVASSRD